MVVDIFHTLIGFAAVTNLMLGIVVFTRKKNDLAARIFLLLSISIFLWSSENFSDFLFRFLSFLITLVLSLILLRSIYNELKLKESLQGAFDKQTNFLAHIAHKLKTPLAIQRANLDR